MWVLTLVAIVEALHPMLVQREMNNIQRVPSVTALHYPTIAKTVWQHILAASGKKAGVSLASATSTKSDWPRVRLPVVHEETPVHRTNRHDQTWEVKQPQSETTDCISGQLGGTKIYNPEPYHVKTSCVAGTSPPQVREYVIVDEFPPPKPVTNTHTAHRPLSDIPLHVQPTPKIVLQSVEVHLVPVGRPAPQRAYIPPANVQPVYTLSPTILPGTSHMVGSYVISR